MRLNATPTSATSVPTPTTTSRAQAEQAQRAYTRPSARPTGSKATFDLRTGLTKEYLQEALTTRIGKAVQETLAANGLDINESVGVDFSAEATADRIFRGTTSLLSVFARQNPKLSKSELIDKFEQTIRGGIKKGYDEAVHILSGFAEFDDSVRSLVQSTQDILDKKLTSYFDGLRKQIAEENQASAATQAQATTASRGTKAATAA